MSGVLFQYRTYRGVDDWLLTLGPCRFFFGGGRRLSYSRKCSNALQSSVVCVMVVESPKPSIQSLEVVVRWMWSNSRLFPEFNDLVPAHVELMSG
ncbi:hypothetical protein F2Q69_00047155 [Brassica cretica]|uniref:Uncharacterized protein n=1 Tax=Brassica cretica TaxID=69181 RepID=A0A8S9Q7N0_BRACR|nr:hypothetical protein F2Q69_00047155 [Brassica cretica]